MVRYVLRLAHLITAMLTLTTITVDLLVDLDNDLARLKTISGIGMFLTGLAYFASLKSVPANAIGRSQWSTMVSKKFYLSLLMTPFTDKVATLIIGVEN